MAPNIYELATRAMRLNDSITCGPEPWLCELRSVCPNHGGYQLDSEGDEPPANREARKAYETLWNREVWKEGRHDHSS